MTANSMQDAAAVRAHIINDFCITFSTMNGSGSATANTTLLRSVFKMGIPVSGKNIFPSNIQGLPTWYTIRINKDGYIGRLEKDDIVVAMNQASIANEIDFVLPGGVLFYPDDLKVSIPRSDITVYAMPVKQLVKEAEPPPHLRDYMSNMVYVGVVAQMLGIDMQKITMAVDFHFKGKKVAVDSNMSIINAAAEWAKNNLVKADPYRVEPMTATEGMIMAEGNTAAALGSIYGGVQFAAWYPITPASSLAESLNEYLPVLRKDPVSGKDTFVAEDELAAIGMAVGAGFSGLRSMTSTSGPGLSLMTEYLGLAYYSETPVVVWDVQRVGPSTGLPTRTAQADLTFAYFMSHGDTQFPILLPGTIEECFEFGWKSFDLAERLQTPILVLIDLDLGMNQWMSTPFVYPELPMDRGKVLWEDGLEKLLQERGGDWGRYLDIDGDGIPYRTIPGNTHPRSAYFARGTGHDDYAKYSEDALTWEKGMERLVKKYEKARDLAPAPVLRKRAGAKFGIIACGSTDPAIHEACDLLEKAGLPADYLRVRALPINDEVRQFVASHECVYVVEINRDGQLRQLLTLEIPELATRLRKAAHMDGLPLTARWIKDTILEQEGK
jgi:2-oxoglutarate ferredoxin oxidoreductase subunit alpha